MIRGILGFEHVDGTFLGVFLVVGTHCFDDVIVSAGGNGGAVVLAIPTFRGIGGVEEFLSPAVIDPHFEGAQRLVFHLEDLVTARWRIGSDEVGHFEQRGGDSYLVRFLGFVGGCVADRFVKVGCETYIEGALFGELVVETGSEAVVFQRAKSVDKHLEFAIFSNLPREIVGLARHLGFEVHSERARAFERMPTDDNGVGLVVDMLHLIDVGCIEEDVVVGRLITGEVAGTC